jgi:hypothetical protein
LHWYGKNLHTTPTNSHLVQFNSIQFKNYIGTAGLQGAALALALVRQEPAHNTIKFTPSSNEESLVVKGRRPAHNTTKFTPSSNEESLVVKGRRSAHNTTKITPSSNL